ncbi:MAG TPA: response regulator [Spirochaetota bacterium]|nr:response regulator [Spirochaetota bacterium]HOM39219.1 response regulator [Spirochaetota bacterium]HPP04222.1 response regulator [Spirochaetota bacterium]
MAIKTIIVDDIFNTRALLKQLLTENGYMVVGDFEDGLAALDFFYEEKPDLAILDYNLNCTKDGKNYTGIDLMKDIKKIKSDVKVIFISANAEPSIIKNAVLQGASDFIAKPFNLVDLIQRINKVCKK